MKKIIFATILISSIGAKAQFLEQELTVPFQDNQVRGLGYGYDYIQRKEKLFECINFEKVNIDETTNLETSYESNFSTSESELVRNIDTKFDISASYKLFKVMEGSTNIDFSLSEKFRMKKNELALNVSFTQKHGRIVTKNPTLKDQYNKLLTDGRLEEFKKYCGTHFVATEFKRTFVTAMIKVSGLELEEKKELEVKFKQTLSASSIGASGELNASYKKFISDAQKKGNVSIKFYAIGGKGVSDISDLIIGADLNNLSTILNGLANFAKNVDQANAAPLSYKLMMYPEYPVNATNLNREEKEVLNNNYNLYIETLEQYKNLLIQDEVFNYYSKYKKEDLTEKLSAFEDELNNCFQKSNCQLSRWSKLRLIDKNNILDNIKFETKCSYTDVENKSNHQILSNIKFSSSGRIYFMDEILDSVELYELNNHEFTRLIPNINSIWQNYDQTSKVEVLDNIEVWYNNWAASLGESRISVTVNDRINDSMITKAQELFESTKNKEFWAKVKLKDGHQYLVQLGKPDLKRCSIIK